MAFTNAFGVEQKHRTVWPTRVGDNVKIGPGDTLGRVVSVTCGGVGVPPLYDVAFVGVTLLDVRAEELRVYTEFKDDLGQVSAAYCPISCARAAIWEGGSGHSTNCRAALGCAITHAPTMPAAIALPPLGDRRDAIRKKVMNWTA